MYSCYNSSSDSEEQFQRFIADIEHSIRSTDRQTQMVIGGDFNAWSAEWGSATNDHRGEQLSTLMASLDFLTGNTGSSPTYCRMNAESVIDVNFSRTRSPTALLGWRVLEDIESGSDHSYVEFRLGAPAEKPDRSDSVQGWFFRRLNEEALSSHLLSVEASTVDQHTSVTTVTAQFGEYLKSACDASMPPRTLARDRRADHLWSKDIAERKATIGYRRAFHRSAQRSDEPAIRETLLLEYRAKRKELRNSIRDAQEKSWTELCKAVDNDPWGPSDNTFRIERY